MEDALAVEVLEAPGDVQGQGFPGGPGQVVLTGQQLLQGPPVDVLQPQHTSTTQAVTA